MAELNKEDLAGKDFLDNIIPSKEQLELVLKMDEAMKSMAKASQSVINKAQTTDNKQRLADIKAEREEQIKLEKIAQEKNRTQQTEIRLRQQLKREQDQKIKADEKERQQAEKLNSAYERQNSKLNELRKRYKDLAIEGKHNTKEGREMLKSIQDIDSQLKIVDASVGQHTRSVGNYSKAMSGATRIASGFGLALGGIAIARNALNIIVDFDQALADLTAISGKSAKELEPLNEQAKQLGATTAFSATQVTELQIELAKLGFTTQQIGESAEPLLSFASATGADLASAAALGGSALRAFGLEASEMERVVSTLGVATTKTALDFSQLETGLSTVAPVAASFGFSVEDTTALLGQLANAGFDASSSATATRNILLSMADANGDLAQSLGRPIKSVDDLALGLQELQAKGIDLAEALELTDKRSVAAFSTFLKGSDSLVDLRDSITDVSDELKEMADKRLNSVAGATKIFSSAWEGLILKLNEGTGVSKGLQRIIEFLANNLETIAKVVGVLVASFLSYKTVIIATRLATTAYNSALALMSLGFGKANTSIVTADKSMKAFNATSRANVFGLLISLATLAVGAFFAFRDSATDAEKAQRGLNEAIKDGANIGQTSVQNQIKFTQEFTKSLEDRRKAMILAGESESKINETLNKEKREHIAQQIKLTEREIKLMDMRLEKTLEQKNTTLESERSLLKSRGELMKTARGNEVTSLKNAIYQDKRRIELLKNSIKNEQAKTEEAKKQLQARRLDLLDAFTDEQVDTVKAKRELTDKEKAEELKRLNDLSKLRERAEDLEDQRIQNEFERKEQQLWRAYEREIQLLKGNENEKIRLRKELQTKLDNDLLGLEKEQNRKSLELVKKALEDREKAIEDARQKQIDEDEKMFQDEMKALEKHSKEQQLAILKSGEKIDEQEKERLIALLEEKIKLQKAYGKDVIDLEIELQQLKNGTDKKELETEKQHAENLKAVADALTDFYEKQFDKRLELIKREEDAAQKQADFYRDLAAQGNINAEQSILEQQRIVEEAQRERDRIEKQKARLQLVSSGLSTYQSKVSSGDKTPLVSTITEISALTKFLATLPAFFDGTEDTGSGGGIDGKGGFHAILHPHERVMTAKENAKVDGISNPLLADIGYKYRTGQLIDVRQRDTAGNSFDLAPLMAKYDKLINAVEDLPRTEYNIEGVVENAFSLVKTVRRGNEVITTKTRFKA
jgi:TP901 family phage tail tape measure protein